VTKALNWFIGIPGKIIGALSGLGSSLYDIGKDMIQGLLNGAKSLLRNIGKFFLDVVPGWIRGPLESALGIASPSKVFAQYGRDIGNGLIVGVAGMRPAVAAEVGRLADAATFDALPAPSFGGAAAGGGLGYRAPGYDMTGATGGATAGATHTTIVSGVVGPEDVAAIVRRDQETTEFLAGANR
jgi:hypothetical protein